MSGWQRIPTKKWFQVHISCERTVRIYAEDEDDAMRKAEEKVNKRDSKWVANAAYEEE